MAASSQEFKLDLESKALPFETIVAQFKAARAISYVSLVEGYLRGDKEKTNQFYSRVRSQKDTAEFDKWAKEYFSPLVSG